MKIIKNVYVKRYKMKHLFYVSLFFIILIRVQAQFNTVKRMKHLLEVQVNITNAEKDSAGQKIVSKKPLIKSSYLAASMPLAAPYINSNYGNRQDPLTGKIKFHAGIDFKGASDSVMVILPGKVSKIAYSGGLGNYIEVAHNDFTTVYGHLSIILVWEGLKLESGTVIGLTGSTGRSTGDHLHFALKYKSRIIDPATFLDEL